MNASELNGWVSFHNNTFPGYGDWVDQDKNNFLSIGNVLSNVTLQQAKEGTRRLFTEKDPGHPSKHATAIARFVGLVAPANPVEAPEYRRNVSNATASAEEKIKGKLTEIWDGLGQEYQQRIKDHRFGVIPEDPEIDNDPMRIGSVFKTEYMPKTKARLCKIAIGQRLELLTDAELGYLRETCGMGTGQDFFPDSATGIDPLYELVHPS